VNKSSGLQHWTLASGTGGGVCSVVRMREILFICTGNYYRSRYSEALFNHEAARCGLDWRAFSRGLAIHLAPSGLSPHTTRRLEELGISREATGAEPIQVREADFKRAARVVALKESEHRPYMARLHPEWEKRITYWDVSDLDAATSEVALGAIEAKVFALVGELKAAEGK
jgi:protein-tyrosine phosphatase